jgi:hypothetical protein
MVPTGRTYERRTLFEARGPVPRPKTRLDYDEEKGFYLANAEYVVKSRDAVMGYSAMPARAVHITEERRDGKTSVDVMVMEPPARTFGGLMEVRPDSTRYFTVERKGAVVFDTRLIDDLHFDQAEWDRVNAKWRGNRPLTTHGREHELEEPGV